VQQTTIRRHLAPSPLNSTTKEDLDDILEATLATDPTDDELDHEDDSDVA